MRQYKISNLLFMLLLFASIFTACSSSNDEVKPSVDKNEVQLNTWIEKEHVSQYNYKEYYAQMNMEIIHTLEFAFSDNSCTSASESVHFDNNSLRDTYLTTESDYHSGNTGFAIRDLKLFVKHTKEEIKAALSKGDYTGSTLEDASKPESPKYTVDQLYGIWVCTKTVGEYFVDNFKMSDVLTYEEGDTREMYEFNKDGTVKIWHAKSIQETPETYSFVFHSYSSSNFQIQVKNGSKTKWTRRIDYLSDSHLTLFDSNYLNYKQGYTLSFEKVK